MKVVALHETNFQLNAESSAIVGPSGSGKTTFLTTLGQLQEASRKDSSQGKETGSLTEKEKQISVLESLVSFSRLQT